MIPITNVGSLSRCFVKGTDIEFQNLYGWAVATDYTSYTHGSVGDVGYGITTNTCLEPGESGVIIFIEFNLWDDIEQVEMAIDSSDWSGLKPNSRILPTQLTYTDGGFSDDIILEYQNYGSVPGEMNTGNLFVVSDSLNRSLGWGYLGTNMSPANGIIYSGQSGTIESSYINNGTGASVYVFLDYEDYDPLSPSPSRAHGLSIGSLTPEDITSDRNRRESETELSFNSSQ